ncbi:low temperature requirement protein A [Micromonospora inaquosa]|nr:low temperature requirement protein A [Micromonospora inaquosa]
MFTVRPRGARLHAHQQPGLSERAAQQPEFRQIKAAGQRLYPSCRRTLISIESPEHVGGHLMTTDQAVGLTREDEGPQRATLLELFLDLVFVAALGGRTQQQRSRRFMFWFAVSAVPWLAGAFVSGPTRSLLWTAALAVDYAAAWLVTPHRALLKAAIEASRDPGGFVRSAPNTHLLMVAGVVAASASFEAIISEPAGETSPWLAGVLLGGLALFLLGRARFEYEVFSRVSPSRFVALLVLAVVGPVLMLTPALVAGLTATLVLAGVAVADSIRAHGSPPEPPMPST